MLVYLKNACGIDLLRLV